MTDYGFITIASAIPAVRVGDVAFNLAEIKRQAHEALAAGAQVLCFPELCVTGYSCQDLFRNADLLTAAASALDDLATFTREHAIVLIVGAPTRQGNCLMNSAVVIANGEQHIINKTYLPNYNEFYEQRWFAAEAIDAQPTLFTLPNGVRFAVELCEDLWSPLPPSTLATIAGADIVFNLSASDELLGKHDYLLSLLAGQSARQLAAYVYSSAGFGESTQDVVYGGNAIIYENGKQLAHAERFSLEPQIVTAQIDVEMLRAERMRNTSFTRAQRELAPTLSEQAIELQLGALPATPTTPFTLARSYNPHPFIPRSTDMTTTCEEIFNIQVMGLAKRLVHTRCANVVVGISGGLDSTLALLVCVATFDKLGLDRKGIHGITMPGFGTTSRTHDNAVRMMTALGITQREIAIGDAVTQHFADIQHDATQHDVTYENAQARYRTMLLMDIANQVNGLVIGTGDLSELALGWCTYNGDHMSMYAVNTSVPKTLVRYLVQYYAEGHEAVRDTLLDIIATPISPELTPADEHGEIAQRTEDLVGPYELHDFFLYHFMRFGYTREKLLLLATRAFDGTQGPHYDRATIAHWLTVFMRRFVTQQFKRSCLPDGPKVGSVSISPRGDWRMPSDATIN